MLHLGGDVTGRRARQASEPAAERIADCRQRRREMVDLAGEHGHDQRDEAAERGQPEQQPQDRPERARYVPPLEKVGERRQRRGDDHDDQHAEDQADERLEDHRADHQPEREQHRLVDNPRGDLGIGHPDQVCPGSTRAYPTSPSRMAACVGCPAPAPGQRPSPGPAISSPSATRCARPDGFCARATWTPRTSIWPIRRTSSSTTCAGSGSCCARPARAAWCTSAAGRARWRGRWRPRIQADGRRSARSMPACSRSPASIWVCAAPRGCTCAWPTDARSSPASPAPPGTRS